MIQNIKTAAIVASPLNPRKTVDQDGIDRLAESIFQHGILQPVTVRPIPDCDSVGEVQYELVIGERRWRAAQVVPVDEIPAIVRELDDVAVLEIMVIENNQREDIHPMEESDGFVALLAMGKYGEGKDAVVSLAVKLGRPERYIRQRLRLQKLCDHGKQLLAEGELNFAQAMELVKYPPEIQAHYLGRKRRDDNELRALSALDLRRTLHHLYSNDLDKASWDLESITLLPVAGACVGCPKRSDAMESLFPELAEGGAIRCMDGSCYAAKAEAQVKVAKQILKDQGHKKIDICSENLYQFSESKSEGATPVIVGPSQFSSGRVVGSVLWRPKERAKGEPETKTLEQRQQAWESKKAKKFCALMVDAIILTRGHVPLVKVLAEAIVSTVQLYDVGNRLKAVLGKEKEWPTVEDYAGLSEAVYVEQFQRSRLEHRGDDALAQIGADVGVDVEHVRAEAELACPKPKSLIEAEAAAEAASVVANVIVAEQKRKRGRPAKAKAAAAEVGS